MDITVTMLTLLIQNVEPCMLLILGLQGWEALNAAQPDGSALQAGKLDWRVGHVAHNCCKSLHAAEDIALQY